MKEKVFGEKRYLCPYYGTIHDQEVSVCLNEKIRTVNPERSPVITRVKSAEVSDVLAGWKIVHGDII